MKKTFLAFTRMFVFAALMPALSLSLVGCTPEGENTTLIENTPKFSVPNGAVNYFVEDLTFGFSASEKKIVFEINADWTLEVEGFVDWISVSSTSGKAGLHKLLVSVTENLESEARFGNINLMCDGYKIAVITVVQDTRAIDLGLSVKWASCNLGTESPTGYGSQQANAPQMGDWRLPSLDDFKELYKKCSWTWTEVDGVKGQKFIGPSGNSIFLPAAGGTRSGEILNRGSRGYYWTSSKYHNYDVYITFDSTGWKTSSNNLEVYSGSIRLIAY